MEQHFNCHYLYKFTEVFQFIPFLEGRAYSETRDLPGVVPTVDVSTKSPMASSEGRVLQMICPGPTSRLENSSKPCIRANLLASFCTLFLWKMHGHARTLDMIKVCPLDMIDTCSKGKAIVVAGDCEFS